jgi:ASC-1-like (ASCH) protein
MTEQLLKKGNGILSQIVQLKSKMKKVQVYKQNSEMLSQDEIDELLQIAETTLYCSIKNSTYEFNNL